jgi:hypothetical protein
LAERTESLNSPSDHFLIAPACPSANELEIDTIEKETAKAKIVLNVLNIISPIVVFTC